MSVPASVGSPCSEVESALEYCEAKLLTVGGIISSSQSTPYLVISPSPGLKPEFPSQLLPLVMCGVLLGMLAILHVARQAWYIWGGEGAFAFPFDRYVYCSYI
jgi:hypothetical protein